MSSSTSSLPQKAGVPKILLYGATSFTAKQAIDIMVVHPERSEFSFLLGGRTKAKLEALKEEMGLKEEIVVFSLDKFETVKKALGACGCGVVINMAGPYSNQNAEVIIKACATIGIHYVDLTAETPWVAAVVTKYDYLASQTGSCIVPSCGFDSVPSDLVNFLSASYLASRSSTPSSADIVKSQSFFNFRGGVSGGTVASALAIAEMDEELKKGKQGEFALCRSRTKGVRSPRQAIHVYNSLLDYNGSFWMMSPHNNSVVRRSWDLFSDPPPFRFSLSRLAAPSPVSYGKNFTYTEHLSHSKRGTSVGWLKSWITGLVTVFCGGAFFASGWIRSLAKGWLPKAGEGPDVKCVEVLEGMTATLPESFTKSSSRLLPHRTLKKGWFDVLNISETGEKPPRRVVTTMSAVGDPGYYSTSVIIVECALSLVLSHSSLPAIGQQGGVLTPATAFGDVLVQRLQKTGEVNFETVSLEEWRESRKAR